ncbi:MAG TPA: PIG-L family deacetylase [Candidatus Kryptonia bacterium]
MRIKSTSRNFAAFLELISFLVVAPIIFAAMSPAVAVSGSPQGNKALVLMCLSAHPDDEDGATLAYYSRIRHIKAYSIFYTRGEGGQNVTGPELYNELAELRTEETMSAANILGTQIYFLGFSDFGFSKTARETFRMWGGKDSVLSRIVYMIRALKPDVIITNHDTITTLPNRQHGNHQAVGITAFEAFDKAADPTYHPEQLGRGITPWQVKKLYFRVLNESKLKDDSLVGIDTDKRVGSRTVQQIAWDALKQHKTQGMDLLDFKDLPDVFRRPVYKLVRQDMNYPYDAHDLFSGLHPTAHPPAELPARYSVVLNPFSIFVSPKYSLIRKQDTTGGGYELKFHLDTFNHTGKYLEFSLIIIWSRQRLYVEHQVLGTQVRDGLSVTVDLPAAVADNDSLVFNAVPHLKEAIPGLTTMSDVAYLKTVSAKFDSSDYIGLVGTYDNTLQNVLEEFGVKHEMIDSSTLATGDLGKFTTIVLDIRGYLYRSDLVKYNSRLLDYVSNGGNVVCFYNRPPEWDGHNYAPYPIGVTEERVTEEDRPVTILDPTNQLFHYPNEISASDWDGWVQERSIYLPSGDTALTSAKYERLLAMSDEGETEPSTSLLWARYGKGSYVYTSLALYRQIKDLNNGGVRMLFNLISEKKR